MTEERAPRSALDAARKWMLGSGFPLEMQTARAFRDRGFRVEQARYHRDPETQKLREVDVIATGSNDGVALTFVLECKDSSAPWILLVGDQRFDRSFQFLETLETVRSRGGDVAEINPPEPPSVLLPPLPTAYQLLAVGAKESAPYEAIMQVLSAVLSLRGEQERRWAELDAAAERLLDTEETRGLPEEARRSNNSFLKPKRVNVFIPVIVTRAPLIECRLDDANELTFCEVPRGLVSSGFWGGEHPHSIWIVNAANIEAFVELSATTLSLLRMTTAWRAGTEAG